MNRSHVKDLRARHGSHRLLGVLAALLAVAAVGAPAAEARVLVVDDDGGCADARFSTIQSAVDAAVSADEVVVCSGTYPEQVDVQKRIKIFSRTPQGAVIRGRVALDGRGAHLRGFTIIGAPAGGGCGTDGVGVGVFAGATVDFNRVMSSGCNSIARGIVVEASLGGAVALNNNEISGAAEQGILVLNTGDGVTINSNRIRGGGRGIAFPFGGSGVVQDNTIEDNASTGIFLDGFERGVRLRISGNRVRRNGEGIRVRDVGQGLTGPVSLRIEANGVFDNAGDGIRLEFSLGYVYRNRSLDNGGFDCVDFVPPGEPPTAVWSQNIGITDSPSNICRAP